MQLNEKKPSEPTSPRRGDWLRSSLRLGLNASPFTTPRTEGEETIRGEIMRRLRCCHSHPALPL